MNLVGTEIVKCSLCSRVIGEAREDAQYLRIGNANFWHQLKWQCRCGKFSRWFPKVIRDDPRSAEQAATEEQIRNELGKKIDEDHSKNHKS